MFNTLLIIPSNMVKFTQLHILDTTVWEPILLILIHPFCGHKGQVSNDSFLPHTKDLQMTAKMSSKRTISVEVQL
jgi:hypothetical protein